MRNVGLQDFHQPVKVNCMLSHCVVTEYCNQLQVRPFRTQHRLLYISYVVGKMKDRYEFRVAQKTETLPKTG